MSKSFKEEHPLEWRTSEAERLRAKYPDRVPVICEKADRSDIPDTDKKMYLVPAGLTVGQFHYVIRKRIQLAPEKAMFLFCSNTNLSIAALMSTVYEEQKDEDGFLYVLAAPKIDTCQKLRQNLFQRALTQNSHRCSITMSAHPTTTAHKYIFDKKGKRVCQTKH